MDLRNPKARAYGVKQLQRLLEWNYEFFVVPFSSIPDDVLATMNITRAVADLVAFEMMTEAAGMAAVFPCTARSIGDDLQGWQEVERATDGHKLYQFPTGPVRLDIRNVESLSNPVRTIVADFHGALEIVGLPGKNLQKQLQETLSVSVAKQVNP